MLPGFEEVPAKEAGIAGLVTFLLAWGVRTVLRLRAELRGDRAGERNDDAGQIAQEVWERTIQRLESQIERLEADAKKLETEVEQLIVRVNTERDLRYAAEGQSRRDSWRIQALEDELERLKTGKPAGGPAVML